jgi:hypothetical protein
MDLRTLVFVSVFMSPSAACLVYAWWNSGNFSRLATWREKLLYASLPLATLSLLLISGFLIQGWIWDGQSFLQKPAPIWKVLNRIAQLSWILACSAALIGKGKIRKAVSLFCVSLPLLTFFVFWMGFLY